MPIAVILEMLSALWVWAFIALVFLGTILAGFVHGPWNVCWLFAMGCWFALDAYWVWGTRTTKPVISAEQFRQAVLTSTIIHLLYCLPLSSVPLVGQRLLPQYLPLEIFGALLCAAGVGFAIWARQVLAGNWNAAVALQTRHELVQTGPYAVVRHPIYLGFMLTAVGMFLALGEFRAFACLYHVSLLFKKMKSEEAVLQAAYPETYPQYAQKVKRLLPGLW